MDTMNRVAQEVIRSLNEPTRLERNDQPLLRSIETTTSKLALICRSPDPHPLTFPPFQSGNYEEWVRDGSATMLSPESYVSWQPKVRNVLFFRSQVCPEPSKQNYIDLIGLSSALKQNGARGVLIAVSLPGAGASKPHHFHAHIRTHYHWKTGEHVASASYTDHLSYNIRCDDQALYRNPGFEVKEVISPIWGLRFSFVEPATEHGKLVFESIHESVRYASQLHISYNMLVEHRDDLTVTILFRLAAQECPFSLCSVGTLLNSCSPELAERILEMNTSWRWGWSELAGVLHPKSELFNTEVCDGLWAQIYDALSLQEDLRSRVRKQILKRMPK